MLRGEITFTLIRLIDECGRSNIDDPLFDNNKEHTDHQRQRKILPPDYCSKEVV